MKFDKILSFLILIFIEIQLISADSETIPAVDPRIVGGEEATFNGTKYQASIRLRGGEEVFGKGHICGGSLIYNSTILTAAHCLFYESKDGRSILLRQASEFIVVMGTLNRFVVTNETLTYRVKKFVYHRSYDPQSLQNDIALMYLDGEVPSDHSTVEPINLASYQMPTGTTCRINGWGNTFYGDIFPQDQLLTANVSILDPRQCRSSYLDYMKDGMVCAGDWTGQHDACQGDSGGPLVCHGLLVGIVSWGNLCGEPKWPGLYSDVLFYSQWIKTNMIYSSSNTLFINYLLLTISTLVIKIIAR